MKYKTSLLICIISLVILITSIGLLVYGELSVDNCECENVVSYDKVYLFIILCVIFVTSLFYFLYKTTINKKEKIIDYNFETLFSMLDDNERAVVKQIINNDGEIKQSEISKKYGKIKAHRIIKRLENKKIIKIVKNKNKNKIKLKKELNIKKKEW